MSNAATFPTLSTDEIPVAPSTERWLAMSGAEREAFLADSLAALQREEARLSEGMPHSTAKISALQVLRDHFDRVGRTIYIASELPIHYPGERVFAPDLIAVLDVEDTWQDDERMAWVVAQEGRGLDLVLEILYAGDPAKDLLDNVLDYARMGIPEYFVYDRRRQRVLGYRLTQSSRYEPIKAHGGTLRSRVLGLELAVSGGRLRFSTGGSEILETRAINERLNTRLDELESRADADARARIEAEQRANTEAQRANTEAQRADAEAAARQELERQLAELRARIGEG